jgi:hypothetical protein
LKLSKKAKCDELVSFINPKRAKLTPESSLSGGMQKKSANFLTIVKIPNPCLVSQLFQDGGKLGLMLTMFSKLTDLADQVPF